jgi:hypothetical protein
MSRGKSRYSACYMGRCKDIRNSRARFVLRSLLMMGSALIKGWCAVPALLIWI